MVPAVLLVDFFFSAFLWVLSALPWFLLCSPRRRPRRAPSLFPVSLVFLRDVAGLRGRRWAPPLSVPFVLPVFLVVFAVSVTPDRSGLSFAFYAFVLLLVDFNEELYFGHLYGISELRGARQVERFAQCSFRHLPQVVFHLAGSLGVFLIFAAPNPGECQGEGLTQTALSSGAPGSLVVLPPPEWLVEERSHRTVVQEMACGGTSRWECVDP